MRRVVFGILGLLAIAFAAAPASAISVPGCGDFIIFSKNNINFEGGFTDLTGDILSQNGRIIVGAHNRLHGTVTANEIVVGNDAVVDDCVANTITLLGTGTCTTSTTPRPANASCTSTFPPPPIVLPVFPSPCTPGTAIVVPPGANPLPPGCYSSVRVLANTTLTLQAGGTYFIKGELRMLSGSTLIGGNGAASGDARATVNLAGALNTEAGIALSNLNINSTNTSGGAIQVQVNSILRDVLISTLGNNHVHGGTTLLGDSELVALTFFDIEPVTNEKPPSPVCVCAKGFLNNPVPLPDDFKNARACNP